MRDSVLIDDQEHCIICGREQVQRHHIFFGSANRRLADQDGYWVPLCQRHHTGRDGVHFNRELDLTLKRSAQEHYERTHTREQFIERYGRSYIYEDDDFKMADGHLSQRK